MGSNYLVGEITMKFHTSITTMIGVLAIAGLAACGGGGSGGSGGGAADGGGAVAGAVAGFGSIILNNGVEYETDDIDSCEVDDLVAPGVCEDSLAVGMVVSIEIDSNGMVKSLYYDDELEGPVTDVTGTDGDYTFRVFGVDVTTTNPGTHWEGFNTNPPGPDELDESNVEVSGEWQNNVLHASYVEKQDDAIHEAEGMVGDVVGSVFPLTLENGAEITVDASGANQIPETGDYVEVEGTYDGDIFNAIRVEIEDSDDFHDDGEAEIIGTLVENPESSTGYSIGSTDVDISNAPTCDGLVGSFVEAEGVYDQSTSVLTVVECEDEDVEVEMECMAGTVTVDDLSAPKVGTVECSFPGTTGGPLMIEFRDSPDLAIFAGDSMEDPFDLTDVNNGDCVEIQASFDENSETYVADYLELEGTGAGCESYELEGPVDAASALDITVAGITYTVNGETDLPDGAPAPGNIVEIVDENGDGIADEIEVDD